MHDKDIFLEGCKTLGIELDDLQRARIDQYALLLEKWSKKINIIGPDTVPYIYSRHLLDAAQIAPLIKKGEVILDIGAGAGLPSIVLAILTGAKVYACERVGKKVQFMREVKRQLKLDDSFFVLQEDVYKLDDEKYAFDVVTSRAFSELENILLAGNRVLKEGGRYVLLKGASVNDEINNSNLIFNMTVEEKKSITFKEGKILVLNPRST